MRVCLFLFAFAGFLVPGCSDSEPKVNRGQPKRSPDMGRPQGGEEFQSEWFDHTADTPGGKVRFGALTVTPPEGWKRKPPQSSFTLAEFMLPCVKEDDTDARLTLSQAGGDIAANIDRWKSQFGSSPRESKQERIDVGKIKITLVDLSGDYQDQRGPFAPAVKRTGYRMIAAIIPVNGQLHFVKAVGPEKTMNAHAEQIGTFIRSVTENE